MGFLEEWLLPLLRDHGLLIVFLTMVAESACIPIPSEIVVPYGGFLAATGHANWLAVVAVATAANVVGSGIAYAVGRYGGRPLFLKYGRYVFIQKHHLDKADAWFERRGELTVFFTRLMPGVRTFISLPAGIAKMPVIKFFAYSTLGALPWNAALAWLGWAAGRAAGGDEASWSKLQEQFSRYDKIFYVVLGVLVLAVVGWGVWRWRRRRDRKATEV
jgi:membrane protein DedA with SNARE-associated domain